jgi:diaminohydroxyphosphoribosylaminopyrimidine deaminase/5-amino-6-(5-phosphoribosylamino)uracil reductase
MQISGPEASKVVHRLRANSDAIVVGIGTVLSDDPLLTPRDVPLRRRPLRVVLDRSLRTPPRSRLVTTAREWPTAVVFNHFRARPHAERALADLGVRVHGHDVMSSSDDVELRIALDDVMRDVLNLGEVLVEPGPTLARQFFASRRVDRLWVIRSPVSLNDDTAPAAARVPDWLVPTGTLRLGQDVLTEYRAPDRDDATNKEFPPAASADFVLAANGAHGAR